MKTYKKIISAPRLEITHCEGSPSPREEENLTILLIKNSRGDQDEYLNTLLESSADIADSAQKHLELVTKGIEEHFDTEVIYAEPVKEYRHGGSVFSLGHHRGFDYSNNGYIFITQKQLDDIGTPAKQIQKVVQEELNIFNQWLNGEVYNYILYDEEGDEIDEVSEIIGLDNLKAYLPQEWQDEDLHKYIIYK